MEMLQLKYFKAVADCGKINKAAESLFISPPALSATISRLERELGVRLFDRTNNRIVLNAQGEIFLRYVNQIFINLDCAKVELQHSLETQTANIQIAVTTSNLWLGLLAAYGLEYPHITISSNTIKLPHLASINLLSRYSFLFADEQDFQAEGLESIKLFEDRPVVMVHPSHPLAQRTMIDLEELKDEVLFLPMVEHSLNKRVRQIFEYAKVPIRYAHECSNMVSEYMVSEGRGVSFSTEYTRHIGSGLRYIPIHGVSSHWEQRLYWHHDRVLTDVEKQFKQFVIRFFGDSV